ncbi:MAG: methyltransferase domain-containing protein [Candidatus Saganbacteria bacterium]|nr:methyltransferase domain-containing protein [Candidatus Saganbacteria bacterium]
MKKQEKCRVCGNVFFKGPLLQFDNMPKAAQFLPEKGNLKNEHGESLTIYQCSGCGLVQLSSPPVPYYKDVIRAAAFSDEMKSFRVGQFREFVDKYSLKGKKVLEIGCGRGEYLSIMQQAGADAYGLEHLEESVELCKKEGLNVSKGFIDSGTYQLKRAPFAAFFIMNYFEHLPDPNSALRGIRDNLADEAVGLVEVPNFDMIVEKKLFSEFISDHLFYFTKDTLTTALKLNGFEIIECNAVWHDYILSFVVRKGPFAHSSVVDSLKATKKLDLSHFHDYQIKITNEIQEYLCRFSNKNVAIWGAGHQALAIIALANLAGKIKYVVDSATFKQGKYTPATHIPIVSPETLKKEPVDAVIVMAASYSDEVTKIIRQNYDPNIKIAILRDFGLEIRE